MTVTPTSPDYSSSEEHSGALPESFFKGVTSADALKALTDRTGYTLVQNNGQRKYGGPPPDWNGPMPKGCEVFVGKIPRDIYEDELVPILERAGRIYELRLMMEFSHHNRGYAFCMYTNKHEAQQAVRLLNNYELRPGRMIGVCMSIDNCRLFVGGIPKHKSRTELLDEMQQITEGVHDCIMYPSPSDKKKNRGFAFIEYESHRAAAMARRKLIPGKIPLWGQQIAVDWAEPETQVDEDVMKEVRNLYVRGLNLATKEETIHRLFSQLTPGSVERVKKIKDFAFVHFSNREDAERTRLKVDGSIVDGAQIEVTYAKPVDKDQIRYTKTNRKAVQPLPLTPTFFDQQSGAMAAVPEQQMYRPNPPPTMPFMPNGSPAMAMPSFGADGSIPSARVQQPQLRLIGKGSAGLKGAGVRSQYNKMLAAASQAQHQQTQQQMAAAAATVMYRPGPVPYPQQMMVPNAGPPTMSAVSPIQQMSYRRPYEILEEVCAKNNWGAPVYTLHQSRNLPNGVPQFLYRVQIYVQTASRVERVMFQSPRLCSTIEEAKLTAAENALIDIHGKIAAKMTSEAGANEQPAVLMGDNAAMAQMAAQRKGMQGVPDNGNVAAVNAAYAANAAAAAAAAGFLASAAAYPSGPPNSGAPMFTSAAAAASGSPAPAQPIATAQTSAAKY